MTTTIRIFDPAMCCDSGICGPEVDPELPRIAADIAWARGHGARVERLNLAREPQAFVDEAGVRTLLARDGRSALPITLVGDEVALVGRYPDRAQLASWSGLPQDTPAAHAIPITPVAAGAASCGGCCAGGCVETVAE